MPDLIDSAQELEEFERERILRAKFPVCRTYQQKCSLTHCLECDEEIPEGRRKAVPGVELCIDCAEFLERLKQP